MTGVDDLEVSLAATANCGEGFPEQKTVSFVVLAPFSRRTPASEVWPLLPKFCDMAGSVLASVYAVDNHLSQPSWSRIRLDRFQLHKYTERYGGKEI